LQRLIDEAKEKGKKDPFQRNYREFCWMLLEQYDPRFENVVDVEFKFDLPLPYEWAVGDDGEFIRILGFIDLITEPEPGVLVVTDYKTGERTKFPRVPTEIILRYQKRPTVEHVLLCPSNPVPG
jgi:hypothetical protein